MNSKELILAVAEIIQNDPLSARLDRPLCPRSDSIYADFYLSPNDPTSVGGIYFDIDVEYSDKDKRESTGAVAICVNISSKSGSVEELGSWLALANQIQELAKRIEVMYGSVITIDYWDE